MPFFLALCYVFLRVFPEFPSYNFLIFPKVSSSFLGFSTLSSSAMVSSQLSTIFQHSFLGNAAGPLATLSGRTGTLLSVELRLLSCFNMRSLFKGLSRVSFLQCPHFPNGFLQFLMFSMLYSSAIVSSQLSTIFQPSFRANCLGPSPNERCFPLSFGFWVILIKGSWEAVFRVTDDFYSMKGGVLLHITSQWEVWDYIPLMVVCYFTSHHHKKCETILNEWWCESLHHITMKSVTLYSMNDGVRVDITSPLEVWDYTQWMVVWEFTSHHNEKCHTIFNEWWCESWHHITMRSVRRIHSMNGGVRVDITSRWEVWDLVRLYSMNGGVRVYITSQWEVWDYIQWMVVCEFTFWLQIAV